MFCPNCGKKVNDYDNFCKFCGHDLREENEEISADKSDLKGVITIPYIDIHANEKELDLSSYEKSCPQSDLKTAAAPEAQKEPAKEEDFEEQVSEDEEIVVYEIKKHCMALFWPCVFSPLLIAHFWIFYVNIPSLIGFLIALAFLMPIVYPILRYFSDRSVVTTSNLHIRQGVFNCEDICVPLKKIHLVRLRRSFLGRLAEYGHLIIEKENSDKEIVYRYIQNPDDVEFILNNSQAYIAEYLKK